MRGLTRPPVPWRTLAPAIGPRASSDSTGLPLRAQVLGRLPDDKRALAVAAWIEDRIDRHCQARRSLGTATITHVQASRFIALSCQDPSTQAERDVMATKSKIPARLIRSSAANMRGISSWKLDRRIW